MKEVFSDIQAIELNLRLQNPKEIKRTWGLAKM
jgi:hypothetical protein